MISTTTMAPGKRNLDHTGRNLDHTGRSLDHTGR